MTSNAPLPLAARDTNRASTQATARPGKNVAASIAEATVTVPTALYRPSCPPLVSAKADIADRELRLHAFPPQGETDTVPVHLRTHVLLYDGMANQLRATCPEFPKPFTTPSPPLHKIVSVEGAGLGMVATADIACGQTILSERPLFVFPAVTWGSSVQEGVELLEKTLDGMDAEVRSAILALKNAKGSQAPSNLRGIMDTNSLAVGLMPGYRAMYLGLARDISRVNHSCRPNAHVAWDLETMTYTLRAFAPIAAGEEITITYIGRPLSYADRQAELTRKYHFECKCATCSLPDALRAVSDMRRAMIGLRAVEAAQDEVLFQKWLAEGAPEQPLKRIRIHQFNHLDGFRRMEMAWFCMRQEGWFDDALWEPVLARLVRGCSVWESEEDVRKYALDAALLRKTFTGSDGGWAAVAANPRQTDWWAKLGRGAKRAPFS